MCVCVCVGVCVGVSIKRTTLKMGKINDSYHSV